MVKIEFGDKELQEIIKEVTDKRKQLLRRGSKSKRTINKKRGGFFVEKFHEALAGRYKDKKVFAVFSRAKYNASFKRNEYLYDVSVK